MYMKYIDLQENFYVINSIDLNHMVVHFKSLRLKRSKVKAVSKEDDKEGGSDCEQRHQPLKIVKINSEKDDR